MKIKEEKSSFVVTTNAKTVNKLRGEGEGGKKGRTSRKDFLAI